MRTNRQLHSCSKAPYPWLMLQCIALLLLYMLQAVALAGRSLAEIRRLLMLFKPATSSQPMRLKSTINNLHMLPRPATNSRPMRQVITSLVPAATITAIISLEINRFTETKLNPTETNQFPINFKPRKPLDLPLLLRPQLPPIIRPSLTTTRCNLIDHFSKPYPPVPAQCRSSRNS